jgi:hypothetical protein
MISIDALGHQDTQLAVLGAWTSCGQYDRRDASDGEKNPIFQQGAFAK